MHTPPPGHDLKKILDPPLVRALFQKHDSSNLSWKVCKSCVTVPASKRSREQPVIYSRDVLQPSKYLIVNSGKLN